MAHEHESGKLESIKYSYIMESFTCNSELTDATKSQHSLQFLRDFCNPLTSIFERLIQKPTMQHEVKLNRKCFYHKINYSSWHLFHRSCISLQSLLQEILNTNLYTTSFIILLKTYYIALPLTTGAP